MLYWGNNPGQFLSARNVQLERSRGAMLWGKRVGSFFRLPP
jgi:hypothetical protein